mmetsp:Transcript_34853/g.54487  ORF Transcript_34853/g.54487 Transcript_34853/m.54487 type:complete len:239 (+) Transcript_34853:527-1243(+)
MLQHTYHGITPGKASRTSSTSLTALPPPALTKFAARPSYLSVRPVPTSLRSLALSSMFGISLPPSSALSLSVDMSFNLGGACGEVDATLISVSISSGSVRANARPGCIESVRICLHTFLQSGSHIAVLPLTFGGPEAEINCIHYDEVLDRLFFWSYVVSIVVPSDRIAALLGFRHFRGYHADTFLIDCDIPCLGRDPGCRFSNPLHRTICGHPEAYLTEFPGNQRRKGAGTLRERPKA